MTNYEENWECKAEEQKEERIPLVVDGRKYAELKRECESLKEMLEEERNKKMSEKLEIEKRLRKTEWGILKAIRMMGESRYDW